MKAPELLLKLPEVDSLLFMGFGNFTGIAERFSSLNKKIVKIYQDFINNLAKMIPGEDTRKDSGADDGWMESVTKKAVEIFFSMFGTSTPAETEAFVQKLVSVLKSKNIGPGIKQRFINAAKLLNEGKQDTGVRHFERVFQSLMEGLLISWIETYDKPLITTTYMEMSAVSDVGYHAYPTPERAAFVLTKLIEYREYIEREKKKGGCYE